MQLIHFNSIIVRLKPRNNFLLLVRLGYFNSIIVRLKLKNLSFVGVKNNHFNSIIVRLKPYKNAAALWEWFEFQFYNSSIKT